MATGNSNYLNDVAFSTELVIGRDFNNVWLREAALLAMVQEGKKNWNKGSAFSGSAQTGYKMLIPVALADMTTPANGVTDANEFTAISPHGTAQGAFTQAEYIVAHYRGSMSNKRHEMVLINNQRGNFQQAKVNQLMGSFTNAIADDMASTAADARDAILGVQQVLATSNTVGGIAQGTDTDWAANVTTSAGAFSLDLLDDGIDTAAPRGGNIDLIALAYSSTNNLFGKLRAQIAPAQRIVNGDFKAKYGFVNIDYLGATCISDNRLTAGVICGFDTSTWFYRGDTKPKLSHTGPIQGTDAVEWVYYMFAALGCNHPGRNFRLTSVT